jgi:hypothetical protein
MIVALIENFSEEKKKKNHLMSLKGSFTLATFDAENFTL